jgi:hypothetical protein
MYPPSPWQMNGDLWLSLFRVTGVADHPDGIYGAAFVQYVDPSPLTYHELLVARVHDDGPGRSGRGGRGGRSVNITDIWVDSPASMAGGRELWAIPKDLCDLEVREERAGLVGRTAWRATLEGGPLAAATFSDVSHRLPRVPFRGRTWQQREDGTPVSATLAGSARSGPARGRWTFAPDGPLGFLAGRRSLASFRMAGFSMAFGSAEHNRARSES